jgi:DNA-binding transcriptional regulator YhcF (GntR family)
MEFRNDKAIYLQIADYMNSMVLNGKWKPGDKIPSIREIAALLEVNSNTAMRTYTDLQEAGVIVYSRGKGFYLTENCFENVFEIRKREFTNRMLPEVFDHMLSLNIGVKEFELLFNQYLEKTKTKI